MSNTVTVTSVKDAALTSVISALGAFTSACRAAENTAKTVENLTGAAADVSAAYRVKVLADLDLNDVEVK